MKTKKEILNTKPEFLHYFTDSNDVKRNFEISEDYNILFASYGQDNYTGDAWVLFENKGKLYEVHGSHCSCFGLENQWDAEEVVLKELKNRLLNGMFGIDDWSGNEFHNELKEFLGL